MRGIRLIALLVLGVLTLESCGGEPTRPAEPEVAPEFHSLEFERVTPAAKVQYWELRRRGSSSESDLIGFGGREERAELNEAVQAELDSLASVRWCGFGVWLGRGCPEYYVLSVQDDRVSHINTPADLKAFLGYLGSPVEALFLVYAMGYFSTGEAGSIVKIWRGYEIVTLKYVSDCPVQIDRFLLRLDADSGEVEILEQEFWDESGYCV